jgi:hypothetical protein
MVMRTTLDLPNDVLRAGRSLAHPRGISLGDALAELVRAGLQPPRRINTQTAFPSFELSERARPITLEQTLQAEDGL